MIKMELVLPDGKVFRLQGDSLDELKLQEWFWNFLGVEMPDEYRKLAMESGMLFEAQQQQYPQQMQQMYPEQQYQPPQPPQPQRPPQRPRQPQPQQQGQQGQGQQQGQQFPFKQGFNPQNPQSQYM